VRTPADEAAALVARVLAEEAPYLSRRGRAALSEALALLSAERESVERRADKQEYTTIEDEKYQRWRAQRRR
jgi:hypothetical protein